MAEYWVGPSLRGGKRWEKSHIPTITGKYPSDTIRRAQPIIPRRYRAMARLAETKLHDVNFLARYVAHISVMVLAIVTGKLYATDISAFLHSLEPQPIAAVAEPAPLPFFPAQVQTAQESPYLTWSALPETVIQERPAANRVDPLTYEVREGENPTLIADRYGLQPSTIVWSNPEVANTGLLKTGQKLVIPPVDGILHTVERGDTLTAIAGKYTADLGIVVAYPGNHIIDANAPLVVGQYVMVPGGTYPYEAPAAPAVAATTSTRSTGTSSARSSTSSGSAAPVTGSGCCIWPVSGRITTQPSSWHMALDIATAMGTPIVAADGGRVVAAGWDNTGYGWRIIIDHGNGIQTLYAHMSSYNLDYGDYVNKGDMVGRIGSTGRSSGPHLHFEVRRNGSRQNPWNWLP
jgi:murein DD-endopeptidase MepM/ murein hydrolase activator NlpD